MNSLKIIPSLVRIVDTRVTPESLAAMTWGPYPGFCAGVVLRGPL